MPRTRKPDKEETPLSPVVLEVDDVKLNLRQRRFIEYYLQTGNASKAARMAGYSLNSNSRAQDLLHNPKIAAEIQRRESAALGKLATKGGRLGKIVGLIESPDTSDKIKLDSLRLLCQLSGDLLNKSLSLSLTGTLENQPEGKGGFQVDPRPTESDIRKTVKVLREIRLDDVVEDE